VGNGFSYDVLVKLVSPIGFTASVFTEVTEGIFCMTLSLKHIHLFFYRGRNISLSSSVSPVLTRAGPIVRVRHKALVYISSLSLSLPSILCSLYTPIQVSINFVA
jgi:hypothetical protein